jgi:hypothetical protein
MKNSHSKEEIQDDDIDEKVEDSKDVEDSTDNEESKDVEDNVTDNNLIPDGPIIVKELDTPDGKEKEITELEDKLTQMVNKIESEPDSVNIITDEPSEKSSMVVNELFPSSDDPTDEQINSQTSDIVVNDITVPVEIPGETSGDTSSSNPVVEIKYDNADINSSNPTTNEDPERLKRLMTNMEVKEEVNVVKSDEIANISQSQPEPEPQHQPQPQPSFSLNSLYPNMNNTSNVQDNPDIIPKVEITPPLQIIKEDKPVTNTTLNDNLTQEPKSPRKEMVTVKNEDDIDETSSLANFFDDMKKIVEDKGIVIEKNNDKMFTLFEDANEVEK